MDLSRELLVYGLTVSGSFVSLSLLPCSLVEIAPVYSSLQGDYSLFSQIENPTEKIKRIKYKGIKDKKENSSFCSFFIWNKTILKIYYKDFFKSISAMLKS